MFSTLNYEYFGDSSKTSRHIVNVRQDMCKDSQNNKFAYLQYFSFK